MGRTETLRPALSTSGGRADARVWQDARVRSLPVSLAMLLAACAPAAREEPRPSAASAPSAPVAEPALFEDVTAASGVRFVHDRGDEGRRYMPEIMGSGGCVLDADG